MASKATPAHPVSPSAHPQEQGRCTTDMQGSPQALRGGCLWCFPLLCPPSHHFHNFHFSSDAQVVQESGQVLLHLDAVVIHLRNGEDPHFALAPHLEGGAEVSCQQETSRATSPGLPTEKALPLFVLLHHLALLPSPGTLCWRSRKGSSISIPPSCTIHQTSMWPSEKRSLLGGNMATFLGTSKAMWPAVVSRTSSVSRWEGKKL